MRRALFLTRSAVLHKSRYSIDRKLQYRYVRIVCAPLPDVLIRQGVKQIVIARRERATGMIVYNLFIRYSVGKRASKCHFRE